jgi:hypothetical protein
MRCPRCRGCLIPCADEYSPVLCINCGWRAFYPDALPIEGTHGAQIKEGYAKKRGAG